TSRYSDVRLSGHVYRYGVAIRVLLEVLQSKDQAKLSLPAIAAQVELGLVQANSQLLVMGYVGSIGAQLPAWQEFDVTAFADYMAAVTKLQDLVFGDLANTRPVLLNSSLAADLASHEDAA